MLRVSNRLITVRRRAGGKHAAPRPQRTAAPSTARVPRLAIRTAQGGIALALVLSMGAVVMTTDADPSVAAVAGDDSSLTRAAADRAADAYTAQLRAQAVDAAQAAVDEAAAVRADAADAAVPAELLAELDTATAELQAAMADVEIPDIVERTRSASRGAERGEQDAADTGAAQTVDATVDAADGATAEDAAAAEAAAAAAEAPAQDAQAEPAPAEQAPAEGAPAEADASERIADVTLPPTTDPATTPLRAALDRVKEVAQAVSGTAEQKRAEAAAAQAAAEAAAQAAAEEAARVAAEQEAQRAAWKVSLQGYANGRIPGEALCGVSFDANAKLRCDAAEALESLNNAFTAHFGRPLHVTDSYRSYGAQVACRANKGGLCATPGTSNHGWGLAVDLAGGVQGFGTAEHRWMRENAGSFQWVHPGWAQAGGSKPEPWHWEYVG